MRRLHSCREGGEDVGTGLQREGEGERVRVREALGGRKGVH